MEFPCAEFVQAPDDTPGINVSMWDREALGKLSKEQLSQMRAMVDVFGRLSGTAQGLPAPVTDLTRMQAYGHVLYLATVRTGASTMQVLGGLKVGTKCLFLHSPGCDKYLEISATCVLDFYVHESCQRSGIGLALLERFLSDSGRTAAMLAYDRPSPKLKAFLAKHFGLVKFVPQINNYVVYNDFFSTEAAKPSTPRRIVQLEACAALAPCRQRIPGAAKPASAPSSLGTSPCTPSYTAGASAASRLAGAAAAHRAAAAAVVVGSSRMQQQHSAPPPQTPSLPAEIASQTAQQKQQQRQDQQLLRTAEAVVQQARQQVNSPSSAQASPSPAVQRATEWRTSQQQSSVGVTAAPAAPQPPPRRTSLGGTPPSPATHTWAQMQQIAPAGGAATLGMRVSWQQHALQQQAAQRLAEARQAAAQQQLLQTPPPLRQSAAQSAAAQQAMQRATSQQARGTPQQQKTPTVASPLAAVATPAVARTALMRQAATPQQDAPGQAHAATPGQAQAKAVMPGSQPPPAATPPRSAVGQRKALAPTPPWALHTAPEGLQNITPSRLQPAMPRRSAGGALSSPLKTFQMSGAAVAIS
mmetsp:Transcript_2614/g.7792  ORF Transcript_2614/g.7792 Transcript_2614/m.7792 type:complete len:585 (-) Transcript_2614:536-2290(-)